MTNAVTKLILHAEDDPSHAAIVRRSIQRNFPDVQLMQVGDGKTALDYLYNSGSYADTVLSPSPELIILDLSMPLFSGIEVLSIIKKDPVLQTIPVVIMTTSDLAEERSEANLCGADGFFTKPADFDKFIDLINELCTVWLQVSVVKH
ncbi:MAG: response regulator [Pelovirga sp.]